MHLLIGGKDDVSVKDGTGLEGGKPVVGDERLEHDRQVVDDELSVVDNE